MRPLIEIQAIEGGQKRGATFKKRKKNTSHTFV